MPNTVLVKLPSGETKKTTLKQGQVEVTKLTKPTPSGSALKSEKPDQKTDKKEVCLNLFQMKIWASNRSLQLMRAIETSTSNWKQKLVTVFSTFMIPNVDLSILLRK